MFNYMRNITVGWYVYVLTNKYNLHFHNGSNLNDNSSSHSHIDSFPRI